MKLALSRRGRYIKKQVEISDALLSLRPNSAFSVVENDYNRINWMDPNTTVPTVEEIAAEIERLQAIEDANDYKVQRFFEYPDLGEQLDIMFHEGYDGWKAKIQEIKDKYPKPE